MAITDFIGTHIISNDWMNSDSSTATNAPGHAGYSQLAILRLAADSGADVVRIPLSLNAMTLQANGQYATPAWVLANIRVLLEEAAAREAAGSPVRIIIQVSDTPAGVASSDLTSLSNAVKAYITDIYATMGTLTAQIAGFEFGNEPNEYFSGAYRNSGADFADYINAMSSVVSGIETARNAEIPFIVGGIVYNHVDYMEQFFARLGSNAVIDGFALHPYTLPTASEPTATSTAADLASRRPTDWTDPASKGSLNDFQAALANLQRLMNANGYGERNLSITEIGVPSWLGARNAGADGRDDQARWIAETVGVLDSWDNGNVDSLVFHATLDYELGTTNDTYSVYDSNSTNNNNGQFGESAFGLFERLTANGPVQAKAAAYVLEALRGNMTPNATLYPENMADVLARLRVVVGQGEAGLTDLSAITTGGIGITNGYTVLTQGGNDTIIGSAVHDVIFAGSGNDLAGGGDGADRLYGGGGHDTLNGGAGDDDIYGNTGNDVIDAGSGTNRVDGGTGSDWLVLSGRRADFTITGDGKHVTISGAGQLTDGYNIERLVFQGDGSTLLLANADSNSGNGLTEANATVQNRAATLVLPAGLAVTEDQDVTAGFLTNRGVLIAQDADAGESTFRTTVFKGADTLGTLVLASDGSYVYQVSNAAVQSLAAGQRHIDTFTVTTLDGTSSTVSFTINGADETRTETLYLDQTPPQWLNGTTSADVFVINAASTGFHAGYTVDGKGIVVWNGTKFDILTGFETIRFTDRDVTADAQGRFIIGSDDAKYYETLYVDTAQTQWLTGKSGNDVFVYSGTSSTFQSAKAQDGQAVIVWNGTKFDILTGFETLRFADKDVRVNANGLFDISGTATTLIPENIVQNVAGTQHLAGIAVTDIFVAGGTKSSFGYARTQDGSGVVIWKGSEFDILHGYETIRFTDGDLTLSTIL